MLNNKVERITSEWRRNTLHNFHIVDSSPWPIGVAFSACWFVIGIIFYIHFKKVFGLNVLFGGLACLVLTVSLWFRDIIREGTFEVKYTVAIQKGLRLGVILFIVSETMLFFAFFWAFFHSSLNPVIEIGGVWPPFGIKTMDPWGIPFLNTSILLSSGASLTWAHVGLLLNDLEETTLGLLLTILLAIFFTVFQGYEYLNAPFNISDGIYGSTFYMLTGLHGFHVIVGTLFLMVALYRTMANHFSFGKDNHIGFESAAWYWHFVDVVWIFLFLTVYLWGNGTNVILEGMNNNILPMIVLFGVSLNKQKKLIYALTSLYGMGFWKSKQICSELGYSEEVKVKDLKEEQVFELTKKIKNESYKYRLEGSLKEEIKLNIQNYISNGSIRGSRHKWGLPVRGGRTKSNGNTQRKRIRSYLNS